MLLVLLCVGELWTRAEAKGNDYKSLHWGYVWCSGCPSGMALLHTHSPQESSAALVNLFFTAAVQPSILCSGQG